MIPIPESLIPLVGRLIDMWISQGKDPEAELEALLAAADTATDAAERAKFGTSR